MRMLGPKIVGSPPILGARDEKASGSPRLHDVYVRQDVLERETAVERVIAARRSCAFRPRQPGDQPRDLLGVEQASVGLLLREGLGGVEIVETRRLVED